VLGSAPSCGAQHCSTEPATRTQAQRQYRPHARKN
jgi:hypothetical protein